MMYSDMPPGDHDTGGFIPPPPGAAQGGQPMTYFASQQPDSNQYYPSNWPASSTPPTWLPQQQQQTPFSSQSYGQYTHWNAPTPPGSWGHATPPGSYGPPTPASANNFPQVTNAYNSPYPAAASHHHMTPMISNSERPMGADAVAGSPFLSPFGNSANVSRSSSTRRKRRSTTPRSSPGMVGALALQRSTSIGGGGAMITPYAAGMAYQQPIEEYSARNLARRPREWRPDYDPREGLVSYIPRVIKPMSDVREWSDPQRRTPHEYLSYKTSDPPIYFDLRTDPVDSQNPWLELSRQHRRFSTLDFAQLATTPAAQVMRLVHPSLPWFVDVFQAHQSGVTVHDVLWQLYTQLNQQILGKDWFNECLTDADRARMAECFQERVEGREDEMRRGIKRVDFLRGKVVFEGLVRTRSGIWEIKTRRPE